MPGQLHAFLAQPHDRTAMLRLLERARRSFVAFGKEDLPHMLAAGECVVAFDAHGLQALICVAANRSGWAYLRGAAIADGWRSNEALLPLLELITPRLRARHVTSLAAYGTALWLVPVLLRLDFVRLDWIVTLERHARPPATAPAVEATIRPVTAHDLEALVALDAQVFDPPYQLASGELVEYMVTSGHFVVAEAAGAMAGYACADVVDDEGQIIRLAVHPRARRQGLGRALLYDGLAYCHANGARTVMVNTQDSNRASLAMYENAGFRHVGRRVPMLVRSLAGPAEALQPGPTRADSTAS